MVLWEDSVTNKSWLITPRKQLEKYGPMMLDVGPKASHSMLLRVHQNGKNSKRLAPYDVFTISKSAHNFSNPEKRKRHSLGIAGRLSSFSSLTAIIPVA